MTRRIIDCSTELGEAITPPEAIAAANWPRELDSLFAVAPPYGDACQPARDLPARRLALSDEDAADLCDEYDRSDRREADAFRRALVYAGTGIVAVIALCVVVAWLVNTAMRPRHVPLPMAVIVKTDRPEIGR